MYTPDQAQEKSLASWYKEENPLRLEPRHPLIAMIEESGELMGCFKKHNFKPNWNWFERCECKHVEAHHLAKGCLVPGCSCRGFYPIILAELGDYSYYLRIVTYQQEVSFEMLCDAFEPFTASLEELLNDLVYRSARLHKKWLKFNTIDKMELQVIVFIFLTILERLEVSLETVLDLNHKKLNSEDTQHGWSAAR